MINLNLSDLQNSVLAITVIGIVLVAGLLTMTGLQDNLTTNSAAYNAAGKFVSGLGVFGDYASTLSTIIIAAAIIGVVLIVFRYSGRQGA